MATVLDKVLIKVQEDEGADYLVKDHQGVLVARVNALRLNGMEMELHQEAILSGCEMRLEWESEDFSADKSADAEVCHIKDHDQD